MDWKLVKRQLLKDPDVAREYAALAAEFAGAQSAIAARLKKNAAQSRSRRRKSL
jgi:hypothetical protein